MLLKLFYSLFMFPLPTAVVCIEIAIPWLGIGEYAAFSWTCQTVFAALQKNRQAFLSRLHAEIRQRLQKLAGLEDLNTDSVGFQPKSLTGAYVS